MIRNLLYKLAVIPVVLMLVASCKVPQTTVRTENKNIPASYNSLQDTANMASIKWKVYFADPNLSALIDTGLMHNQELNIFLQEIEISKNEIRARKGEYLPFVGLRAGIGYDKAAEYTRNGAVDQALEIKPGKAFPKPLGDYMVGGFATWELDIWKKLRTAKQAAVVRYMSTIEGKNFMVTNLIAEIAGSYYELIGLDNQLSILQQNIQLQTSALQVVKNQKESAKVTQLAVNRFEAQLLNTQNLQYEIKQKIVETENRIRFLTGKYNQPIPRNSTSFKDITVQLGQIGIPSQLMANRPDIKQAELKLAASNLDIRVARANFYPSFSIKAGLGFQSFNPLYIIQPQSILYNLAGDMMAPLVNKNAITATYYNANAQQIQAAFTYEQTVLNAYTEVLNQFAKTENFRKSYEIKSKEVEILVQSVTIANNLFNSARADYMEVLLTQREALATKLELIEIKMKQLNAKVSVYKALGGGWN